MPLPHLIEIVPLQQEVTALITVPGSKSITNRALILAALATGETILKGALWSEDTQVMVECLQELGYMVTVSPDPHEASNRTVTVYGKGSEIPPGGTAERPLDLFVGNAGTAARFLSAFVCLGRGYYRIHGVQRMHERPQAALFHALRSLGYEVQSSNDKLPAIILGGGARPGKCQVSIEQSSQFASALLLSGSTGGWQVTISGGDDEEASYVTMTSKLIEAFPRDGGVFQIEPDASSGSYFVAVNAIGLPAPECEESPLALLKQPAKLCGVNVAHCPRSGWQIDEQFPRIIRMMTLHLEVPPEQLAGLAESMGGGFLLGDGVSRAKHLGDSIMTAIVIAPLVVKQNSNATQQASIRFIDLGRLRLQECERVTALRTELTKCGARVVEQGDTLEVFGSELHGAEIETYNDHRMAMCFAILGLKVPGIKIQNPACVKKTFPNFFQKLAAPAPNGIGAGIRDGRTGRALALAELFAD